MSRLQGPLLFATVAPYFAQIDELAAGGTLDLGAITQCDSAGAALLLELQRCAQKKGSSLRFINAPRQLRELVEFFGIGSLLDLAE
jgi:phospholipid transport system transporter-binding protein